ncbi:hypothetical protein [Streptomyces sasae]|uniref:hypothetical protein n=1 Tax=Streptomyces sasae TaxID=1266772 RepID=UPI00292E5818|nr:hypothetical protein [Streptomyces sasae]
MAAHVLAGLTVEFVFLLAYARYFWAGLNDSDRPTGHWFDIGAIVEGLAVCLAVPVVLMFCALVAGLREHRVARRLLTGLGWAAAAVVNLPVSLLLILGSEQLSEGACAVASRPVPGGVDLMTVVLRWCGPDDSGAALRHGRPGLRRAHQLVLVEDCVSP